MSPLEEPSLSELIRDLQSDVRQLIAVQDRLVTREAFDAYRALTDKRITDLEERRKTAVGLAWSGAILPILVALVVYLLTGKG